MILRRALILAAVLCAPVRGGRAVRADEPLDARLSALPLDDRVPSDRIRRLDAEQDRDRLLFRAPRGIVKSRPRPLPRPSATGQRNRRRKTRRIVAAQ